MKNRLLLKDLIETLRFEHEIEIRDENGYRLFNCPSTSQVLEPYFNRKVIDWFVYIENFRKVVISIGEEE